MFGLADLKLVEIHRILTLQFNGPTESHSLFRLSARYGLSTIEHTR